MQAATALRLAREGGHDWIRVDKPGHHCDFMVAALEQELQRNPLAVPRAIVNVPRRTHEFYGARIEVLNRNWPGAALVLAPGAHGG